VFVDGNTPVEVLVLLVNSSSAIANNQISGLNTIFGGNEAYAITSPIGRISVNPMFCYDVVSPTNNIAIGCQSGFTLASASVMILKAIRIG
jgi:hypothetical protein